MKQYDFSNSNLPKVNTNEDLETISNNHFRPLLPVNKFEIRSETVRDKGIDFHIELKKEQSSGGSVYTNFRFAVQLKSTETIEPNTDGSLSIQIYSSNINYLLNNGMPAFYVFYHKLSHSFYYENVNNFVTELQKKDIDWDKKEKHSLRFSKILDTAAIEEIYDETFENGILLRQLNQFLKFPAAEDKIRGVIIDANKDVYSIAENIAYIDKFGPDLINAHHFNFIIEIEQRSHPRNDVPPRFNLVCGIAYFQRGNLYKAMELLKLAQQKSESFEPEVQAMLTYTLLNAKFLLGIISKENFDDKVSRITEASDSGSFFAIEKAYKGFTGKGGKPSDGIKKFYRDIRSAVIKEGRNPYMRVTAYAKILDVEAPIIFYDLEINFTYVLRYVKKPLESKAYLDFLEIEKAYLKRMDQLTDFALKNKYFLGVSNLASAKIEWNYKKTFHKHFFCHWHNRSFDLEAPLNTEDLNLLTEACEKLDKILYTYEMLEHRENMVSCLNTKYEILHFIGNKEEAMLTKNKITSIIESNDFIGLKARHDKLINGKTAHERFIESYSERLNGIQDLIEKIGIEVPEDLSEDIVEQYGRKPDWSINKFFEFNFPEYPAS
jgi:tetratricopeptide (TPR) repeat protein